jgi:hypothetical protein
MKALRSRNGKNWKRSGKREVIERKTPDNHIGGDDFVQNLGHIVLYGTLSRRFLPTGKATQARLDSEFRNGDYFRAVIRAVQKSPRQLHGVAVFRSGTAVDHENVHCVSSNIERALSAHSSSAR